MVFCVSPAHSADDESGPQMLDAQISSQGPFKTGDRFTITLVMQDLGGSGVRNVQFLLKDKFGRQHSAENDDKLSYFSTPSFNCSGTNVCVYPFIFMIDSTWANNGLVTLSSIRAFDTKANGTYFYADGNVEDLQTRKIQDKQHALKGLSLELGNVASTPTPTPIPTPAPTPIPNQFVYEQVTLVEQQACQMIVKRMNSNFMKLDKFEGLFPNDQLINSFKSRWKLTSNVYTQANCKFENLFNAWKVDRNYENALNDDFLSLLDQLNAKKSELDDKASTLNTEMNETFNALSNNLNKYKNDISQLFRDYPSYFNQAPELRSSLQRAIDYKIPTAASQSGIDAIRELIGGGSGSALASDFLLAQAGITKYVALENIKAKTAKKTTITCIKGKLTKKVTAVNPKCPAGYKKK